MIGIGLRGHEGCRWISMAAPNRLGPAGAARSGDGFIRLSNELNIAMTHLHLVLLFWNHVLTWASVILSVLASEARSADARYFCRWKRFSSSAICSLVKEVRGFFRLGGVRFWYGWPMRLVIGKVAATERAEARRERSVSGAPGR